MIRILKKIFLLIASGSLVLCLVVLSILWVFFLGFAFPIAIISGFIFGKWYGTLISVTSFTVGSTLLYTLARHYFYQLIIKHLEERIKNYKNLFKKNEFLYFMLFRLAGGGGTPFAIQNVLPVIFNMKTSNYFYSTLLGLVPGIFLVPSGKMIMELPDSNFNLTSSNIFLIVFVPPSLSIDTIFDLYKYCPNIGIKKSSFL